MSKRKYKRFTRRLEAEFSAGGLTYKGISSDISINGMFIRTQHGFVPGTEIEIKLFLPDGEIANLKGIVRRTIKTPHHFIKNGMGIELTWKDSTFENFLTQELLEYQRDYAEKESSPGSNKVEDFTIMVCPSCGVKNRLKGLSRALRAKCGRCGAYLS